MSIQINLYFLHKNKKNVFYSKIYIIYQKLFIFTLFFTFRLLSFLNFKDKKKVHRIIILITGTETLY